jgi:DNA-3-methyladenine glycosylase II
MTTETVMRFELAPKGPFSLEESIRFAGGFPPFGHPEAGASLHLAFVPEGSEEAVGVCVQQESGTVVMTSTEPVWDAVTRILSLDLDASGLPAVGAADPVVAKLLSWYPGLRPVLFCTPFEAAAWSVLSTRVQMRQAAAVRLRMASELGSTVSIHGDIRQAFPSPSKLASLSSFRGLFGRKPEYLRELAAAARSGRLSAERLRALPPEVALAELRRLPGIGEFGAELILIRGCGAPDVLPSAERRVLAAAALAYGWPEPSFERFAEVAERWRPFRSWIGFLLRKAYADGRL